MASTPVFDAFASGFGRIWANPEFRRRLAFTLGALLVFRLARFIPLPGIDTATLRQLLPQNIGAALSFSDVSDRLSIVALGLIPYLTGWAFAELIRGWQGERRAEIVRYGLTLLIAASQAYAIAHAFAAQPGLVAHPGDGFVASTVVSLTAGTLFLLWLGNQITRKGLGNGVWMLIAAEGLGALPALAYGFSEVAILGGRVALYMILIPLFFAAATAMLVGLQLAVRRIPLERSGGTAGGCDTPLELVLPIDRVTILPGFFAAFVLPWLLFPALAKPFWQDIFEQGQPAQLLLLALLVVLLTLLCTAIVASPAKGAETLQRDGLAIQGAPPAETAATLDKIMSRTTVIAGLILAVNAILPWVLIRIFGWPVAIGGMQHLIGIVVALGVLRQMAELAPHRHDAPMEPANG